MTSARRLVVLSCLGVGAIHLAVLAAVRVRETEAELEGVSGDWKAMWAYSASVAHERCMEFPDAVRCAETVCALAPGTPLSMKAAFSEASWLHGAPPGGLDVRVLRRELGRPTWPVGEPTSMVVRSALRQYYLAGMRDEEVALAGRALRELPAADHPQLHRWLVVSLEELGDHAGAVRHFDAGLYHPRGKEPTRDVVLAAAAACRALGDLQRARRLQAQAASAEPEPRFWRKPLPEPPQWAARIWSGTRLGEVIGERQARVSWWSVLNADRGIVWAWLAVSGVLVLLTLFPVERSRHSALRAIAGAIALCLPPVLAAVLMPFTGAGTLLFVAPLQSLRTALAWSTALLGYMAFGAGVGVTAVEGRSLVGLGWRWRGPATWLWCLLGCSVGVGVAVGGLERIATYSAQGNPLPLTLALTCLMMALAAAFTEETLYRGYLLDALSRVQPRFLVANLLQALLFMGVHVALRVRQEAFSPFLVHAAWWLVMPLLAGWVTRRSGSLWPAFVGHAVFDLIAMYATVLPSYEIMRMAGGLL